MRVRYLIGASILFALSAACGTTSTSKPADGARASSRNERADVQLKSAPQTKTTSVAQPARASETAAHVDPPNSLESKKLEAPEACADSKECFPEAKFVERACKSRNPGLALAMFEKRSPWLRGYIRMAEVDSVNTLGGPSSQTKLTFSEEVLVLRQRRASGGVSGTGGYDVLRWDGTCATLAEHELVTWMPGLPQNPVINWKYLDENVQEALLTNPQIRKARQEHRRECRGASVGSLSEACERARKKLSDTIAQALRTGAIALR